MNLALYYLKNGNMVIQEELVFLDHVIGFAGGLWRGKYNSK